MNNKIRAELLYQHWVHSHEEDTATEKVFRPATFNFPRSRGRKGFELKADGTLMNVGIGPTDRPTKSANTWQIENDTITFHQESDATTRQTMNIVSVDANRLVVKK